MILLADGSARRGDQANEVAGDYALNAYAGVDKAHMAVALVPQQHGVTELMATRSVGDEPGYRRT
jgi:hypothetical protein